jgi:uncharacterized integral membrane protein
MIRHCENIRVLAEIAGIGLKALARQLDSKLMDLPLQVLFHLCFFLFFIIFLIDCDTSVCFCGIWQLGGLCRLLFEESSALSDTFETYRFVVASELSEKNHRKLRSSFNYLAKDVNIWNEKRFYFILFYSFFYLLLIWILTMINQITSERKRRRVSGRNDQSHYREIDNWTRQQLFIHLYLDLSVLYITLSALPETSSKVINQSIKKQHLI